MLKPTRLQLNIQVGLWTTYSANLLPKLQKRSK